MFLAACGSQPPPCASVAGTQDHRRGNAGCLIVNASNEVLLIRHQPYDKIGLPGGTARAGELARDCR